jgi:hypothetical protein
MASFYANTTGQTCWECSAYVPAYTSHSCPITSVASGGHFISTISSIPSTTSTTYTGTMKHINWEEYTPARPPTSVGDYLIVYLDTMGVKKCVRGTFEVTFDYKHQWKDDVYVIITQPVTHFARIELP